MHLVPIFLLAGPLVFVHTIPTFNFLSPFISDISYVASVPQGEVDAAIPGTLAPAGVGSANTSTSQYRLLNSNLSIQPKLSKIFQHRRRDWFDTGLRLEYWSI